MCAWIDNFSPPLLPPFITGFHFGHLAPWGVKREVHRSNHQPPKSFQEDKVAYHYIPKTRGAQDVRSFVEDLRNPFPRLDLGVVKTPFASLRRFNDPHPH